MMLEDRYLVWRLKRGIPGPCAGSTTATRPICSRWPESLLGRTGQAEDVLQDVFVQFIESIDTFELTGSLKGYLATCVANRARDYHRGETDAARGEPMEAALCDRVAGMPGSARGGHRR